MAICTDLRLVCADLARFCADSAELRCIGNRNKPSLPAAKAACPNESIFPFGLKATFPQLKLGASTAPFHFPLAAGDTKGAFRPIGQASPVSFILFRLSKSYGLAAAPEGWKLLLLYRHLSD